MDTWLITSITLGVIQGLTEIFPISSTAHLIIAGKLINFTGDKASFFEVAVQFGSILAVVLIYWKEFLGFLFPIKGRAFTGLKGIWLLFLTTLPPGILGFFLYSYIKILFTPQYIVFALTIGSFFILLGEYIQKKVPTKAKTLDEITPNLAIRIGFFQCLALWPGFSRSASTIIGGMILGVKRTTAVEYSFIAAVPVMLAATGYDTIKNWSLISINDLPFFSIAMLCAFISAWFAIKAFFALITTISLRFFAYYRLILAAIVYLLFTN